MIQSDYVFYSTNELNDGCCVLVGNFLITAGHVVADYDLIIVIGGVRYCLSKENALVYAWNKGQMAGTSNDIAVFLLKETSSPITFDSSVPYRGMKLKSISYEHIVEQTDRPNLLFGGKLSTEYFRLNECEAIVKEIDGNFFLCEIGIILRPGSSGSPIFNGDKFTGILHGGQEGTKMCVFQSAKSISALIDTAIKERNEIY